MSDGQFALPSISETGPLANKSIKATGKSPAVMHNPFAPAPYFNVGGRAMTYTEADFDRLSWHDCHIWAVELRPGDSDAGDWTSDFALDIDFIVEWICGVGGGGQFRVAPATLVFHGVTDPKIDIDWGRSGYRVALHPLSIGHVERAQIQDQKVYLDRPYYSWRIRLNWPDGGQIAFGAVGFTQTLRAEPVLTEKQCLSLSERIRLTSR